MTAVVESETPSVDGEIRGLIGVFDAGLLNDFGGGNVGWWHDYIRSLLGEADQFYREQMTEALALFKGEFNEKPTRIF